ncbi:MAG: hypothetical protein NT175_07750 [Bacteroidetes bacterium]|nr:hypothetical protein [Bacteroidota bacterium]
MSAFTSLTVHIMGIELPIGRSVKDTVWKKLFKDSNHGR